MSFWEPKGKDIKNMLSNMSSFLFYPILFSPEQSRGIQEPRNQLAGSLSEVSVLESLNPNAGGIVLFAHTDMHG